MGSACISSALVPSLRLIVSAIFFLVYAVFPSCVLSGPTVYSIEPNFTATNFRFIDDEGVFLSSPKGTFRARITNLKAEKRDFYFNVFHRSGIVVWIANRNNPVSDSSELRFSSNGLALFNDLNQPIWSTSRNLSSISSLQLLESGNLVLLDKSNNTVWESFDFPTDVLVAGQKLKLGKSLVSSVNEGDFSQGNYSLVIEKDDALLKWNGLNYWKLSMETGAIRDSFMEAEFLMMNYTGVYLMGKNGEVVVIRVNLPISNGDGDNSSIRIVKLEHTGVFTVQTLNSIDVQWKKEFKGPDDNCKVPFTCKKLGVCTDGGSCRCAPGFHNDFKAIDCSPTDGSLSLPGSCINGSLQNVSMVKYMNLRDDLDYFYNDFTETMIHVNLSTCQTLCSTNCSCFGYFFSQFSGSCYMIMEFLGSFTSKSSGSKDGNRVGFIKTIVVRNPHEDNSIASKRANFPVFAAVLLPSSGVIIIALVATFIWLRRKRRRWSLSVDSKLDRDRSLSIDEEIDFVSIPGLPVRFRYEELDVATERFRTRIGSGGFGIVYKGTLPDGTDIAVKKITCLGARGRREFLTEIAIIGKIHHVNLVKLKGFCAQNGQKFLVYEFMNRGSLDATLFHGESVLEWKERYSIALGTARGLAYLHTGCEQKIIHCDVKPENILLHDKSMVKISDFGLSKLLSPEESCMFTTLRGTRGYLAPEWLTSSSISEKTDVYGYGMVLLEIIRGKKNSSPRTMVHSSNESNGGNNNTSSPSSGESGQRAIYYPLFALDMHAERRYLEVVDQRLLGRVEREEIEKLVRVALCCVHEDPNLRPSMPSVVGMLEGVLPVPEPRMESLNFLRFYGRRFTEESRLEENTARAEDELQRFRQITSSENSFSYVSSQQVSGPR